MRQTLIPHSDSPCPAVTGIDVEIVRSCGALTLAYAVIGAVADLSLPPAAAPARTDELWRTTCFEAFVRPAPGEAYFEFNFAPSTEWAAYAFDATRAGMRPAIQIPPPVIEVHTTSNRFELRATLDLAALPAAPWAIGLSAVIEDRRGAKSYWALAHPAAKPDFHHPDAFALILTEP